LRAHQLTLERTLKIINDEDNKDSMKIKNTISYSHMMGGEKGV